MLQKRHNIMKEQKNTYFPISLQYKAISFKSKHLTLKWFITPNGSKDSVSILLLCEGYYCPVRDLYWFTTQRHTTSTSFIKMWKAFTIVIFLVTSWKRNLLACKLPLHWTFAVLIRPFTYYKVLKVHAISSSYSFG